MRMKKLMILAVAAIALVACSKTFDMHHHGNEGTPIGFGTWTETLTKTHDPNGSVFAENDNFKVYGFKTLTSGSSNVFNGTTVTKGASDWTYAPLRYWDTNASSYTFFAFAPATLTSPTASETSEVYNGTLSATAVFDGKTDVLVAAKKEVTDYTSAVDLYFYHIASLLDLKVRKADNLELSGEDSNNYVKVAITGISLSQIDATGTFTIDSYAANTNKPGKSSGEIWAADGSAAKATYTNASGFTSVALDSGDALDIPTVTGGSYFTAIDRLVVMPQSFRTAFASAATEGNTDQTVTISYDIIVAEGGVSNTSSHTVSFDLKEFDDTPDAANTDTSYIGSWAPGTHYTYVITIGANAITFTADIQSWDASSTGYHYLLN